MSEYVTVLNTTVATEIVTLEKHNLRFLLVKYLAVTIVEYFSCGRLFLPSHLAQTCLN